VRSGSLYGTPAVDVPTAELSVVDGSSPAAPPPPVRPTEPPASESTLQKRGLDPSTAWQEIDEPIVAPVYLSQNAASSRSSARRGRRRRRRTGRVFLILLLILMLVGGGVGVYVAKVGPIEIPGLTQIP
jgi:hypothetical protein